MTWLFSGLITDSLARQSWGRQGHSHFLASLDLLPFRYTLLTALTLSPALYTAGHWDGSSK